VATRCQCEHRKITARQEAVWRSWCLSICKKRSQTRRRSRQPDSSPSQFKKRTRSTL